MKVKVINRIEYVYFVDIPEGDDFASIDKTDDDEMEEFIEYIDDNDPIASRLGSLWYDSIHTTSNYAIDYVYNKIEDADTKEVYYESDETSIEDQL